MSSAKPRKKKSQKAPETEEQKAARKALLLQKEEERRRKKEEFTHSLLHETAALERKQAAIHQLALQHTWRRLMRQAKEEELKRSIDVTAQAHEREVDRKDAILQKLTSDLEDIEEQFQTAIRSHAQHLDQLLLLHRSRTTKLDTNSLKEFQELESEFESEKERRIQKHGLDKGEVREVMDRMEGVHRRAEAESKQEFQQQRQDIKDKNSEEFSALRIALDSKIDSLELQFEQANKTYVEGTAQQTVRFKQLTEQDLQNAKTIEINARKLQRLQDSLNHWRTKMATNVRECEERNRALKEEKDAVAAHFQELKGKMNRFREGQQRRLVTLTKHVDSGLREISRKVQRAEKVLGVAEMNSKLETEEEALLALRPPLTEVVLEEEQVRDEEEEEAVLNPFTTTAASKNDKKVQEWNYLDSFFRRSNKVALDNMALENERARLQKENEDLRAILKQYLDGISVNDDALRGANPLFIATRAPTAARPQTITPQQLVLQYQRT